MDYFGQYMQMGRGLLAPIVDTIQRLALMKLQQQEQMSALQKRAEIVQNLASQLTSSLPSDTETKIENPPSFTLPTPTLFKPSSVSTVPQPSKITEQPKSPTEYAQELYEKTLPILAQANVYGLDFSPMLSNLIKKQEETFQSLNKFQTMTKVLPKLFPDMDQNTASYLALGIAQGDISVKDIKDLRKKDVQFIQAKSADGTVYVLGFDKDSGGQVFSAKIQPDLNLLQQITSVKEGAILRRELALEGARHANRMAEIQLEKSLQNNDTKYQHVKIRVPASQEEIKQNPVLGVQGKEIPALFDPRSGNFYDPVTKQQIDPRTGSPVSQSPNTRQPARSVFDLYRR
ncbi:hypothetical protein Hydth_0555 [Hydrogenobacter thermophilus TK-6]|uniref:Uncharacterized protein n=1 Tax=Hydrogenobacter thermophilus (strain DSM 6534 / IAM 12695 / TK-6) TaxID=608538 RepID=D3DGR7_HYDTT|nr:hypothetical protein [Hydrogenobacter thermophilus]ADO44955.1 hypothetical protein Hydth_0555 [Hydrogenobacter thermophilus TK-6]BAI69019.1 hypothetical protein HTH_0557 [Hydrogenobacter thermophilus TK-6]